MSGSDRDRQYAHTFTPSEVQQERLRLAKDMLVLVQRDGAAVPLKKLVIQAARLVEQALQWRQP